MPYTVTPTNIPDLLILEPKVFGNARRYSFERGRVCVGIMCQYT